MTDNLVKKQVVDEAHAASQQPPADIDSGQLQGGASQHTGQAQDTQT